MRVTGVQTRLLSSEHPGSAPLCVVELLSSDASLTGIAVGREDVRSQVTSLVDDLLIGEDARAVAALWQTLTDALTRSSSANAAFGAAALVDLALWDLKAKARGEPLWKTLGGARPNVNVHACANATAAASDEALAAFFTRMARELGVRAGKLRASADISSDLRRLGLVADALADALADGAATLIFDAAERQSPKDAIRRIRRLERDFDLAWVEGASARHDFLGMKRVSSGIRAAVCGGAGLCGLSSFLPHLRQRGFDMIQLDPLRLGVSGTLQLADAAFGLELPVVLVGTPGNLGAQLSAALPNVVSMEITESTLDARLLASDVRIEAGRAIAGDRSGNGLIVNAAEVA